MSRFQKVRGYERNPRSRSSVISSICSAQRIYLETGGEDIDFGIRSARAMLKVYHEQCEGQAPAGVEPVTHDQANRARAQLASLTRQRERKLEQIHAMVEEMYAHADQFGAEQEQSADVSPEPVEDVPSAITPVTDRGREACDPSQAKGSDPLPGAPYHSPGCQSRANQRLAASPD
jgi:hypothetical protein